MVKRHIFEGELVGMVAPAITHAQDVLESKYGVKFEVKVDWKLTRGSFDDEEIPKSNRMGG